MANFRGQDGSVSAQVSGTQTAMAEVKGWSVNVSQALLDASVMGDSWERSKGGMGSWTGQITAHFDKGDAAQNALLAKLFTPTPDGSPIAVELRIEGTTKKIAGNIIITQVGVVNQLGSLVMATFDFKGSGAPTLPWT